MTSTEKGMYLGLLVLDSVAILVSMIAGPIGQETIAISAAVSAIIISLALIIYGIYFWRRRER